jgi:hypothetical protein
MNLIIKEPQMAANNTIMSAVSATVVENGPTWAQIEEMKNYVHEAGHAVVARLTGFPVAWVSVDADFIGTNPLAIENECNNSPAVCLTISSARLNPIISRKSVLNKAAKDTITAYCMHVLAGPFAEYHFDPASFFPEASNNDFAQVTQVLAMTARSDKAMRKKIFTTARRNLTRMLDKNWDLVTRVAYELVRHRTIMGDDLDYIMSAAIPKDDA